MNARKIQSTSDWANALRNLANNALQDAGIDPNTPLANITPTTPFRDDMGHTRPVDPHFFAWRLTQHHNTPAPVTPTADAPPDALLWHALTADTPANPADILAAHDAPQHRDRTDAGALFPQHTNNPNESVPLEVWTERELASAHALGWLARTHPQPDTRRAAQARLDDALDWHLDNLQPDNATNHPWAIHLFLQRDLHPSPAHDPHAPRIYAETLLHNCQVSMGRPDTFSAHILLDAADWLAAPTPQHH